MVIISTRAIEVSIQAVSPELGVHFVSTAGFAGTAAYLSVSGDGRGRRGARRRGRRRRLRLGGGRGRNGRRGGGRIFRHGGMDEYKCRLKSPRNSPQASSTLVLFA